MIARLRPSAAGLAVLRETRDERLAAQVTRLAARPEVIDLRIGVALAAARLRFALFESISHPRMMHDPESRRSCVTGATRTLWTGARVVDCRLGWLDRERWRSAIHNIA
jgi:hypothetical protein